MKSLLVALIVSVAALAPVEIQIKKGGAASDIPWSTIEEAKPDVVNVEPAKCEAGMVSRVYLKKGTDHWVVDGLRPEGGPVIFYHWVGGHDGEPDAIYFGVMADEKIPEKTEKLTYAEASKRWPEGPCGYLFGQKS